MSKEGHTSFTEFQELVDSFLWVVPHDLILPCQSFGRCATTSTEKSPLKTSWEMVKWQLVDSSVHGQEQNGCSPTSPSSPYSPCHFLFPKMKLKLKGKRFNVLEIQQNSVDT
jgi:hypothetical protein